MTPADFNPLIAFTLVFVVGHFLLSSEPLRGLLRGRLGENGFRMIYSAVALVGLVGMIRCYGTAPYHELWPAEPWMRFVPAALMPFAFILLAAGVTTRSATTVGGEALAKEMNPAPGIMRVTRHPFLWGVTLWAASHLVVNGDLASLVMMGGVLILALGGMVHIDMRRERALGSDWGPIKLTTSLVPFAALLSGRTTMDWAGLGLWRIVLGAALYVAFMAGHELLIGVPAHPV